MPQNQNQTRAQGMNDSCGLYGLDTPVKSLSYLHMSHGAMLETLMERMRQQDEREAALERDLTALLVQNEKLKKDLCRGATRESWEWNMTHKGRCDDRYTKQAGLCQDLWKVECISDTSLTEVQVDVDCVSESSMDPTEPGDGHWDSIAEEIEDLRRLPHGHPHAIPHTEYIHTLDTDTSQDFTSQSPSNMASGNKREPSTNLYTEGDGEDEDTTMQWVPKAVFSNPLPPKSPDILFCPKLQLKSPREPVCWVKELELEVTGTPHGWSSDGAGQAVCD